jgi:hypothetical protein
MMLHLRRGQVIPCPLVTSHGDGPDGVQDVAMIRTSGGVGFTDIPFTPDTLPPCSSRTRRLIPAIVGLTLNQYSLTAGGLAAEGMLVSRLEVRSLFAAPETGALGDPLLLFRGILAVFTHYHGRVSPHRPNRCHDMEISGQVQIIPWQDGVKVFPAVFESGLCG